MKTRASLIFAALLALTFVVCSRHPPAATTTPQPVTFAGFTNGYVGVFAPWLATLSTNYAATVKQWLADGTNNALFTITNRQSCVIFISPFASIRNAGAHPTNSETLVLNATDNSGIFLAPGQYSTLQIALVPHQAPWRLQFSYTRDDQHVGFLEGMLHLIFRKPIVMRAYTIQSDLINQ